MTRIVLRRLAGFITALLCAGMLLPACDKNYNQPVQTPLDTEAVLTQGNRLFAQHCAQCHGKEAAGDANWRVRGSDGKFPPPPLNGTGHAWHHPTEVLIEVIKYGSPGGQGNMPAFEGRLKDEEIIAVIEWFKSLWPEQAYQAWHEIEQRSLH